jgi:hypothetical protein
MGHAAEEYIVQRANKLVELRTKGRIDKISARSGAEIRIG